MEDVSTYPALTAELLRRGYTDEDVKKILGKNILRVMRAAERVSARDAQDPRPIVGDHRSAGQEIATKNTKG